jgi:hypothetical protein
VEKKNDDIKEKERKKVTSGQAVEFEKNEGQKERETLACQPVTLTTPPHCSSPAVLLSCARVCCGSLWRALIRPPLSSRGCRFPPQALSLAGFPSSGCTSALCVLCACDTVRLTRLHRSSLPVAALSCLLLAVCACVFAAPRHLFCIVSSRHEPPGGSHPDGRARVHPPLSAGRCVAA